MHDVNEVTETIISVDHLVYKADCLNGADHNGSRFVAHTIIHINSAANITEKKIMVM
jgi:hypothetical protein